MWTFLALAASLASAQPGEAQRSLIIQPGQTVVVEPIGTDGGFHEVERAPVAGGSDQPPTGRIRFIMTSEGGQTFLRVQNGTAASLRYRAVMSLGRRSARTSTCIVPPGIAVFEHWPHPLDRIEASQFVLTPGTPDTMSCAEW